ncbi:MAG TPA: TonB-dependent receptor plug domain-containing protein, partial [Sphingobacteriaceae bacterium]|nr:TonB-dependent receptor plug domain-containing protein [Sphingobacteriaceae bacterium]
GYAIFRSTTEEVQPHVLIDGQKGDLNQIDPNSIESIVVIKGDTAIQQYGTTAKNGVIRIKTKQ